MKRKLIASLLCLCMLVSLLPVAAFATEDPPPVIAANIGDSNNPPYTGTPSAELNGDTITITVDNLKTHANGAGQMGNWVGVGIPREEGDTYVYGYGEMPSGLTYDGRYTNQQTVGDKTYYTFYFDAVKGDKAYLSVKSTDESVKTYKIDMSKITLADLDVKPAELNNGTTNRPQGDNADVYTVTGAKEADKVPTITVKATGLKKHENASGVKGHWVGVNLPALPAAAGASYAWGFGKIPQSFTANASQPTTEEGAKYTSFYFNADGTTNNWSDGGYISVQHKSRGHMFTYHYKIVFDVQEYNGYAINGMGFEAVADDANNAINSKVQLDTSVTDCDVNTMYAYFNSLVQGTPGLPVTLTFKNAKGEEVYTWNADAEGGRVVYFTFNQSNTGSPASEPISSGTYTAELKYGNSVASTATLDIYSVSFDAAGGSGLSVTSPTYYEKGKEVTLPTGLTKTNYVFTGWKDDKGNVVSGKQTVTGDVTYTAQWDEVKIVSASLKTTGETPAPVAGVSAAVEEDTIKLTGAIAQPAEGGATYKLAYTTNEPTDNSFDVILTYKAETKEVSSESKGIVGEKTYTVDASALKVLPANVTIVDGGVAAVDEKEIAAPGLMPAEKTTLVNNIKATTGSFDTQSETLSALLTETATSLTKDEVAGKLEKAKEDATNEAAAATYDTLAVVPVLSIESVNYDRANEEMTLVITPAIQYEAVSNAPQNYDNIPVGNPIPMSKEDAAKVGPVVISFKAPAFAATSSAVYVDPLYVMHNASAGTYEYKADNTAGVYTFTNPHGFSTFVVSKTSDAVAYIGGVGYMTLKEAVEAAEDGDTIALTTNCKGEAAKASVALDASKTVTFTGTSGQKVIINDIEYAMGVVTIPKSGGTTPVDPSNPGSSGGGGSSASVSVPSTSNGKVTVSNNNAKKGDTVTITLTPNDGYVVDTVTVTDSKGNTVEVSKTDDTHYTFVMPDGRVTVKATFKKADTPPATGFTDVPADAYYADAVKWAVDNGITNGLTATTFGPNNSCTRGQMVTFLWRAAGSPAATGTNSFSDVASGEYYYNAVLWAVEKGITNGTSATTFSPNATVNRGQTVTFLYRYAESPAATGDTSFTDVAADAFYADAVKWAVAEGITNGTSDTTFAPASNCTRGQIVTFMYRQMAE